MQDVIYIDPSKNLGQVNLSLFTFLRELKNLKTDESQKEKIESEKIGFQNDFQSMDISDRLMKMIVNIMKDISVG